MRILIVGFSTRAIAESAVKGQHDVVTVDYFGDLDQREFVPNYALQRDLNVPFSAEALLAASDDLNFDAVAYGSNLENAPEVVDSFSQRGELLGNSPGTLRDVRDWATLRAACEADGIPCPTTLLPGEEALADSEDHWLRKPARGGGGRGIRRWRGEDLGEDHILQRHIEGLPSSAAFVADGTESVVIGLTEQLLGRKALGADGFLWCGNILPLEFCVSSPDVSRGHASRTIVDGRGLSSSRSMESESASVLRSVEAMTNALTRRFGLRGANGVDLVIARGSGGRPDAHLVEINPRYTASMELIERAYQLNVFSCHVTALKGRLPDFALGHRIRSAETYFGKGIVYARHRVRMPDTRGWVHRDRRDIPFPGEEIDAGHPICTVLAQGQSRAACWRSLVIKADEVRREISRE